MEKEKLGERKARWNSCFIVHVGWCLLIANIIKGQDQVLLLEILLVLGLPAALLGQWD